MLSKKHLQDICMLHSGDHRRCRYLAQDDTDWNKWYCLKQSSQKDDIDGEISDFITDTKNRGEDPKKAGIPLGNNCSGFPILKFIEQGYDK